MRVTMLLIVFALASTTPCVLLTQSLPLLGLDLHVPVPEDNAISAEKVALGRKLFFDPLLSRDRSLACASCHMPEKTFTDGRPVARGVDGRTGVRHVPTLINRAYGRSQFWDGRAAGLEAQAVEPIVNRLEMDLPIEEAVDRLSSQEAYRGAFLSAFERPVNSADLARALASYVRTIRAGDAPYDRYLHGDRAALDEEARHGLAIFRGKGHCSACHGGPTLSDEQFHNTGIAWNRGKWRDPGRFAITGQEADRGAFKTPTLREVARTAPYMHDGSLASLDAVVEFYDRGGRLNPRLDPGIRPLGLSVDEKRVLVAFLRALTGSVIEGVSPYNGGP